MKIKSSFIVGIVFLLVISLVSAGLIDYFGRITGTVEVSGPVFYLDGYIDGVYHNLLINEIPSEEIEVNWNNGHRIVFKTEPLNVNGFYKANFDIHIWAKTNYSDSIIQLNIIKINENEEETPICGPVSISIGATQQFQYYHTSCSSSSEISLNPDDRFGLEIHGVGNTTIEYWIRPGHKYTSEGNPVYDRIEVSAA